MLALVFVAATHGMAVSSRVQSLTFEAAKVRSLNEVSAFFVDAFWLASTTFPGIELNPADRRQLAAKVAQAPQPTIFGHN